MVRASTTRTTTCKSQRAHPLVSAQPSQVISALASGDDTLPFYSLPQPIVSHAFEKITDRCVKTHLDRPETCPMSPDRASPPVQIWTTHAHLVRQNDRSARAAGTRPHSSRAFCTGSPRVPFFGMCPSRAAAAHAYCEQLRPGPHSREKIPGREVRRTASGQETRSVVRANLRLSMDHRHHQQHHHTPTFPIRTW